MRYELDIRTCTSSQFDLDLLVRMQTYKKKKKERKKYIIIKNDKRYKAP